MADQVEIPPLPEEPGKLERAFRILVGPAKLYPGEIWLLGTMAALAVSVTIPWTLPVLLLRGWICGAFVARLYQVVHVNRMKRKWMPLVNELKAAQRAFLMRGVEAIQAREDPNEATEPEKMHIMTLANELQAAGCPIEVFQQVMFDLPTTLAVAIEQTEEDDDG
jgi:hypothetical protein